MEIKYWDCKENAEVIHYTTMDAAIAYGLQGLDENYPETIRVYGFGEVYPKLSAAELLDMVLARLDQKYPPQNKHIGATKPTTRMFAIAEPFCRDLLAEYGVKSYIQVAYRDINVKQWIEDYEERMEKELAAPIVEPKSLSQRPNMYICNRAVENRPVCLSPFSDREVSGCNKYNKPCEALQPHQHCSQNLDRAKFWCVEIGDYAQCVPYGGSNESNNV